ncbi:hypothetical protein ACWDX8_12915, partial [Streptomyces anthocyanicus]
MVMVVSASLFLLVSHVLVTPSRLPRPNQQRISSRPATDRQPAGDRPAAGWRPTGSRLATD